jgi:hypothetical protein
MSGHDDFELKRSLDALPRSIEPPEDLWPGVRARIARAASRPGRRTWVRLAAAAVMVVAIGTLLSVRRSQSVWTIQGPDTQSELTEGPARGRRILPGTELKTGPDSRLALRVANIGAVELAPGSAARLLEARPASHRLALTRGSLHARITAPPRLFVVETPSATAVDLGCEYTLEVDSSGHSRIRVTLGWVSLESRGRQSLVPAGFQAVTRPGSGLSTPWADGAPDSLRAALTAFDSSGEPEALGTVLALARRQDAISLWHLLSRTDGAGRRAVYQRLAALVPPPAGVTRDGILDHDPLMLRTWWEALPGALPVTPEWTRRVWRLWLRFTDW